MPTTPCPACGSPVTYNSGVSTLGCPKIECRVVEFYPRPPGAIDMKWRPKWRQPHA